jgi:hypothetical protein
LRIIRNCFHSKTQWHILFQGDEPGGVPAAAASAADAASATAGGLSRQAAGRINFSGMGGGSDSSEEVEFRPNKFAFKIKIKTFYVLYGLLRK